MYHHIWFSGVLGDPKQGLFTLGKHSANPVIAEPRSHFHRLPMRYQALVSFLKAVLQENMAQTLDSADKLTEGLLGVVDSTPGPHGCEDKACRARQSWAV